MNNTEENKKQGIVLMGSGIVIGILYQLLIVLSTNIEFSKSLSPFLTLFGSLFNAVAMGGVLYLTIGNEFMAWFKHFSLKWLLIGIPLLFATGTVMSLIWSALAGSVASNSINSVLSWSYIIRNVPVMLLGEELLSIGILYGAWKKLNWQFWQASLLCAVLFAAWHITAYDFNLLQCLVTIIPSRLVLNYLFKKSNSIWVTVIVHITFDVISFLFVLL